MNSNVKKARILLVDDDPDIQLLYTSELEAAGFLVRAACDGMSCLVAVQRDKPDLVILDLGLPGGDGETTLRNLRSNLEFQDLPVLILSAREATEWGDKLQLMGASAYMQKPVLPERLEAMVRELLDMPLAPALPTPAASARTGTLCCPHCGHEIGALV